MKRGICIGLVWAVALLLAACVQAEEPPKPESIALRGTWIATAGPNRYLRGFWTGEILPQTHDAARGTWTLLSDRGQVLLTGDWTARKYTQEWSGAWTAHVARGKSFSGSWAAAMKDSDAKSFEDMLKETFERLVSGSWQSGKMQGSWQLQGSR